MVQVCLLELLSVAREQGLSLLGGQRGLLIRCGHHEEEDVRHVAFLTGEHNLVERVDLGEAMSLVDRSSIDDDSCQGHHFEALALEIVPQQQMFFLSVQQS